MTTNPSALDAVTSHSPASSPELPDEVAIADGTFNSNAPLGSPLYTADQMNTRWLEGYEAGSAAAAQAAKQVPTVPEAVKIVLDAMRTDPDYAWSWHCNIAMAFVDEGGDHAIGNHAAARFLRSLADVEPAHELPEKKTAERFAEDLVLNYRDAVQALGCAGVDSPEYKAAEIAENALLTALASTPASPQAPAPQAVVGEAP